MRIPRLFKLSTLTRFCVLTVVLFIIALEQPVYGSEIIPLTSPSVILMEQTTGKVLYGKDEHTRMYPASMTKVLTALVVLDYLDIDDVITVGEEIYGLQAGAMLAGHAVGESITVHNLLRALIIRSGNETGCVLALNTIRAKENRMNIAYREAEKAFCDLMNAKARELGALDSHFSNPHGLHGEDHYTTAYDMALISRAYMEIEVLREIAVTREYSGDGLDGQVIAGAKSREYTWTSHNELITGGSYSYTYATGIKTGFTDEASDCVAASAEKKGIQLIAIVFYSPSPGRWQDARILFDYGFDNFSFETIQEKDAKLDTVRIANHRLGESETLSVLADDTATDFMGHDELDRLKQTITYDERFIAPEDPENTDNEHVTLVAPIEPNEVLGVVTYTLDGNLVFEGTIRAAFGVEARDFESDMDYYLAAFKDNVFSIRSLPYWFGGVGLLVGLIGIFLSISGRRKSRPYNRYRGYR